MLVEMYGPGALVGNEQPQTHILLCRRIHLTQWVWENDSVPYWRLYWNRTPGATLIHNGRRIPLRSVRFYLVPPNTITSNRLARPVDHYFMHFVSDPPFETAAPGVIQFPATPELIGAFRALARFPEADPRQKKMLAPHALWLCYYALANVPPGALGPGFHDQRIKTAIACMDNSMASPADNQSLAHAVGMHTIAFIRLFKQRTGYSPQVFFQIRRIEHACRLLHFSRNSIEEIATATGFYDRFHFSRVFKNIRAMTPAEFRRQR